jgi:hypothetical protein
MTTEPLCAASPLPPSTYAMDTEARVPPALQLDVDLDEADEEGNIMMTMHLWKAEALTGILELSADGTITKADAQAALILGCPATSLQRQHISKYAHPQPTAATQQQLLPP